MPKTETQITNFKINRGTYAKIQENIAQIGENELIITTDKSIPVPTTNDNGKVIKVVNGDYSLEQDATGGTVTSVSVSMNGTTKGTVTTSGTIDLGTVLTSHQSLDSCVKLDGGTLGQTISSTVDTPVYLKSGTTTSYIGFKKSNGSIVGTIGFGGSLYQRPVFSLGSDSTLYQLAKYNDIPTNNNQLTNGAGYITNSALSGYATQTWVGQQGYLTSQSLNGYATQTWVQNQGYLTSHQSLSNYLKLTGEYQQTIQSTGNDTPLKIRSGSSATETFIGFVNGSGTGLGYIGFNSSGKPVIYDGANRKIITNKDFTISGGTLTIDLD